MDSPKLNCLIYGSTGAVGRLIARKCFDSDNWQHVFVVVRKETPLFDDLKAAPQAANFHMIVTADIMDEAKVTEESNGTQIHCVFNCLGSQVKHGKDLFIKIDKTFVIQSCKFAHKLNANLFSHVTTNSASKDSMFLYLRVKGECEEELKKTDVALVSIHRPGLIADREGARCGEKFFNCCPCVTKIKAVDLAKGMVIDAENRIKMAQSGKAQEKAITYENNEIRNIAKSIEAEAMR